MAGIIGAGDFMTHSGGMVASVGVSIDLVLVLIDLTVLVGLD